MEAKRLPYNLPVQCIPLLRYLIDNGPTSQKELIGQLNMPLKTLRYAIRRLTEERMIRSKPDLMDMRSLKYEINDKNSEKIEEALSITSDATV